MALRQDDHVHSCLSGDTFESKSTINDDSGEQVVPGKSAHYRHFKTKLCVSL